MHPILSPDLQARLSAGMVIPALPLALDAQRRFDPRHQQALLRYYLDAGAGGIAVGVHSTQFAIRDAGLYEPLLAFAAGRIDAWAARSGGRALRIAGVHGPTRQAVAEAGQARTHGYHAVLASFGALRAAGEDELLVHLREVSAVLPTIGFFMQEAVGGRPLGHDFWRRAATIPGLVAVKLAPFNRYQTIAAIRGIVDAGRAGDLALYTGNDDSIVHDLVSPVQTAAGGPLVHLVGGLLGHWGVWTRRAVELHRRIAAIRAGDGACPRDLLTLAGQITDMNAAVFDPAHGFAGCIPGIHEVLRRQGLLAGTWCLDSEEVLSPGQVGEIDRVCRAYPHLTDDDFVRENLGRWLEDPA